MTFLRRQQFIFSILISLVVIGLLFTKKTKSQNEITETSLNKSLFFENTAAHDTYKIKVCSPGITRINYFDFPDFSHFSRNKDISNLRLYYKNREIPLRCTSLIDGKGYVEFFADPELNRDGNSSIYWLFFDKQPGLRIKIGNREGLGNASSAIEYVRKTIHFEENQLYRTSMPNRVYLHWTWKLIRRNETIKFQVGKVSEEETAIIRVFLYGMNNSSHRVRIYLNEHYIGNAAWYSSGDFLFESGFDAKLLNAGQNEMTLETEPSTRPDAIFLDWFEIDANVQIDITSKYLVVEPKLEGMVNLRINGQSDQTSCIYQILSSKRMTFFQEKIRSNSTMLTIGLNKKDKLVIDSEDNIELRTPEISAATRKPFYWESDVGYLMIAPKEFSNEIVSLAKYYNDRGMKTRIVTLEDIYDRYSGGLIEDVAIKQFLADAYRIYGKDEMLNIVFVGDASYDEHNLLHGKLKNYIPTHLFDSRYQDMQTATDDWFIIDQNEDLLPIALGRLPVQNRDELQHLVNKILEYHHSTQHPNNLLFVNDASIDNMSFNGASDRVIQGINSKAFNVKEINLEETVNANKAINLSLEQGVLIFNYIGHGSLTWLSKQKLYDVADIDNLDNVDKLPFVILATCLSGFFHHHDQQSVAETFLLTKNGGIACLAPTGFAGLKQSEKFLQHFYRLLNMHEDWSIGRLIIETKRQGIAAGDLDLDDTNLFVLLGDPAIPLKRFPSLAFAN